MDILAPYSEKSFVTLEDKAEFNYRKGRILQKSDKTEQSVSYFERAVTLTKNSSIGFGASAALQLGYISKDKKQNVQAIFSSKLPWLIRNMNTKIALTIRHTLH